MNHHVFTLSHFSNEAYPCDLNSKSRHFFPFPHPVFSFQADFGELLGLTDYMDVMMLITFLERVVPVSDERVKVVEERFDGVEVVVYEPQQGRGTGQMRRAIIYMHGGGWCLGSSSESHKYYKNM